MKHRRYFERANDVALREVAYISTVISDLDRVVRILDYDLATEEERARIFDRSDAAYPMLDRTLAARRDNLRDTIAALEKQLANLCTETVLVPELA
jgi:septation ring formation regulator EzrA